MDLSGSTISSNRAGNHQLQPLNGTKEDQNQHSVARSVIPLSTDARRRQKIEGAASMISKNDGNDEADSRIEGKERNTKQLGTFNGVILPCVSNILGVIIFVRLSWIVGVGGISNTLLIAFMSTFLTFLTALSLNAIASNGKIAAGGVYFMVSRSLGKEFGGSVGILFALANTVGGVLYILGFVEIMTVYAIL
jgi:hypothetical protein